MTADHCIHELSQLDGVRKTDQQRIGPDLAAEGGLALKHLRVDPGQYGTERRHLFQHRPVDGLADLLLELEELRVSDPALELSPDSYDLADVDTAEKQVIFEDSLQEFVV